MAQGGTARGQGRGSCVTFPASLRGGGNRCRSPLQAVSLPLESGFRGISSLVSMGFLEEKDGAGSDLLPAAVHPQHPISTHSQGGRRSRTNTSRGSGPRETVLLI